MTISIRQVLDSIQAEGQNQVIQALEVNDPQGAKKVIETFEHFNQHYSIFEHAIKVAHLCISNYEKNKHDRAEQQKILNQLKAANEKEAEKSKKLQQDLEELKRKAAENDDLREQLQILGEAQERAERAWENMPKVT